MEAIIYFILGILITLVLTKKPINIKVHHLYEDIVPPVDPIQMEEYEKILTEDKQDTADTAYEKMGEINDAVADVFGGSDRL